LLVQVNGVVTTVFAVSGRSPSDNRLSSRDIGFIGVKYGSACGADDAEGGADDEEGGGDELLS